MRHPDSDIIQRPTQRNMGPDTETHSKEHGTRHRDPLKGTWDQTQRPAQRNMGGIQTVRSYRDPLKGTYGTRHRDPLKGTWDETSRQ